MSINFCTLASTTVDTFCGNIRAKVLATLIEEKYQTPPPHTNPEGSGGWTFGPISGSVPPVPIQPQNWNLDKDPLTYEQPWITVTVFDLFANLRGSETIETTSRLDFVTVTDVTFNSEPEVTVNITEMEFSHARNRKI